MEIKTPKRSNAKYSVNLEKNVNEFLDKYNFLNKTYTAFRMLKFAKNKGLKFDKFHSTWHSPNNSDNVMRVAMQYEEIDNYILSETIYKPYLTISNLLCQVVESYKAEFLEYLHS